MCRQLFYSAYNLYTYKISHISYSFAMNSPPFYFISTKFLVNFVIFSLYVQYKVKKDFYHFQEQNTEEGKR